MNEKYHIHTRAIHAGQHPDPSTGAVMTPIFQTSTYAQEVPGGSKWGYARTQNPTRTALQECLSSLNRFEEIPSLIQSPELAAENLRTACAALGKITGRVDVEDLLDVIFNDFCIGK